MNLTIETGVPVFTVFVQGLLSFFSPCILPLVPLYISYLTGGMYTQNADGSLEYPRKKLFIQTLFFVLGIGFAFILLGLGFTAVGRFFSGSRLIFTRIGGIIMVGFGLYQLGLFGKSRQMEQTRRLPVAVDRWTSGPVMALILGFTFSFAWTPCVGPVLASVLLMASSAGSAAAGFALIGVYMLGFVLPFLAVGLFAGRVLDFFNRKRQIIRYTVKAGGILLILMGVMTFTGWMNGITGYLSAFGGGSSNKPAASVEETVTETETDKKSSGGEGEKASAETGNGAAETETEREKPEAPDFTLTDQYGESHTLSDYEGKTVFLNFWATWCGPCQMEMPDIQALYEEFGNNAEDVVILGVANPKTDKNLGNADVSQEEVRAFLEENAYTYPTVMDLDGSIFRTYGIQAFPTTFMIDKNGDLYGYVPGMLSKDMMKNIIQQTIDGTK